VIAFEGVAARRAPLSLASISLTLGPGIHALVGGSADGGLLLLALAAGRVRPRSGRVRVLGGSPTDLGVRPQVAFVPLEAALPEAMSVAEVLTIASAIRDEPVQDAEKRLASLGVQSLAPRGVGTLSSHEARAVAVAEAVTSSRVRVLLIDEPFVSLDPRAVTLLPEVLRARAHSGWAVVFATASVRDAGEIADDHILLKGGAIVGRPASLDALAGFAPQGVLLRIVASDPRILAAALAREECVEAVARKGAAVITRGRDVGKLARAAARAIMASGVNVTEIRVQPPSLDEVRSAAAGVAAGVDSGARPGPPSPERQP
jgi:ABC-2 type transport system ATP-binding protein